ncbi:MAG: sugar ABC transporter permease [Chloroflexi bacterium]|nr:sugar ABC transporter permease [Chloroflexota bacterium]
MGGFSLNLTFQPKRLSFWESLNAWIFVAPWILGFILFTGGPILASLVISFTEWDIVNPPVWAGLGNYELMLRDPLFFQSLKVTTLYALVAVPLQIVVGLFIAILLNTKIRLIGLYRTLFYLPAVLPIVSVAVMWRWILSRDWGLINWFLSLFGVYGPGWLSEPEWALPALILMSLWGVGSGMLIYLAGLQGIPTDLYEAAKVDGAGAWASFVYVTLPMISPVILFQLVVGLIAAFQVFAQPFIMTQGGPQNATLFYLLHLFRNAFEFFRMGYASALSWVLFIYIAVLTVLIFRFSAAWVFYEGEIKNE